MPETIKQLHHLAPPRYAILGEQENTYFRLTTETGEGVGRMNVKLLEAAIKEKFWEQTTDFFVLKGLMESILCDPEKGPKTLGEVPMDVVSGRRTTIMMDTRRRIEKILPSIIQGFGDMLARSENPEAMIKRWEKDLAGKADQLIDSGVEVAFRQSTNTIALKEEVKNCIDIVKLFYMAMDRNYSTRIRFEAKRKLALMYYFAKLKMAEEREKTDERIDHTEGLDYLIGVINRELAGGGQSKIGEGETMIIESVHDEKDGLKAIQGATRFLTEEEASKKYTHKRNKRRTSVEMRKCKVKNEKGEKEEIMFHIISRDKSPASTVRKNMSEGIAMAPSGDKSGIRMIFETEERLKMFFENMETAIKEDIRKEIEERTTSRTESAEVIGRLKDAKDRELYKNCAKIEIKKKGKNDGEPYKGRSIGSSEEYQVTKIVIEVERPDEEGLPKKHIYEVQALLPHEFIDYFYRVGTSWKEYAVNRWFVPVVVKAENGQKTEYCSLAQLLFPEEIYKKIDHEEARLLALESVVAGLWPEYAAEKTEELRRLIRQKAEEIMAKTRRKPQVVKDDKPRKKEKIEASAARRAQRAGNTPDSKRNKR